MIKQTVRGVYMIKKWIGVRVIKTAIGATLAMVLAQLIGLQYTASAGIIAILSTQSTRKQAVALARKRLIASAIALIIASVLFKLLGFNGFVFGLYLLFFIPIVAKMKAGEGIAPASVLVTHLLAEQEVTLALLANEMMLVALGAGVALVLNLYMPSIEGQLQEARVAIEEAMYTLFMYMAKDLEERSVQLDEEALFQHIQVQIQEARHQAYKHANNHLFADASLYERYFGMRWGQYQVLLYMRQHFSKFFLVFPETQKVADFTRQVAESIKGRRSSHQLLEDLDALREYFKGTSLPKTREEFESRAMLYQFLNDIEHFLEIKKTFRERLTDKELAEYLRGYGE